MRGGNLTMLFSLVQIWRTKQNDSEVYESLIQQSESAGARAVDKPFESKEKMIEIMNGILATQVGAESRDISNALAIIEKGILQYSGKTQLDLTDAQAESLGWVRDKHE